MSNLMLKDLLILFGLCLFPFMLFMVWKGIRLSRRIWKDPEREAAFAGFPRGVAGNPRKCHRYFVALAIGICLLAWAAVVIPTWAVTNNHLASIEERPSWRSAERVENMLVPFVLSGFYAILIAPFPILYAYFAAWVCSRNMEEQ
jgi:uncharacterized membrane protein